MQKAYMIGNGVAGMAAALYLIRDGGWHGEQIQLYGLDTHGSNDGNAAKDYQQEYNGNPALKHQAGYLARGGRMLNEETYEHFWDAMRSIPSLDQPGLSITDEILAFDHAHPTNDKARLISAKDGIINSRHMGFNTKDRALLTKLMLYPEKKEAELDQITIREWFKDSPHMFTTNFWFMWKTTFAFKEDSSAMELRRYMNRMILEFSRINTLEGVTRTPYNQYESIVLPMRQWLSDQGVHFIEDVKVIDIQFKPTTLQDDITVTGLVCQNLKTDKTETLQINEDDFVFDTCGSITDSASIGDLNTPIEENMEYAPSAALWKKAAEHFYNLGNPDVFFNDRALSEWCSFTVTTNNHLLLNEITRITTQQPGNALNTFVDSNECLSIVVHHQPHFKAQKENETIFWGYALYPRQLGDFVKKPFIKMTGQEMLTELLGHLNQLDKTGNLQRQKEAIQASIVNVIPVYMPYASSMFNPRSTIDRPEVVPAHSTNLAFLGQYVEQPFNMTYTEMYSFSSAMIAVYTFLGKDLQPVFDLYHHYEKDPKVLAKATKTMFR